METDRDKLSPGGEFLSILATNLKDRLKIRNDIWHLSSVQTNRTTGYAVKSANDKLTLTGTATLKGRKKKMMIIKEAI